MVRTQSNNGTPAAGTYYVWTIGCQMNRADSRRAATELERLGYQAATRIDHAGLIVLNSCVVRQSAEDKVTGRLHSLRPLKEKRPGLRIVLMGCLVGDMEELQARFPFVDLFVRPSDIEGLLAWVQAQAPAAIGHAGAQPPLTPALSPRGEGMAAAPASESLEVEGAPTPPAPSQEEGARPSPNPTPRGVKASAPISGEVPAMFGCDRHCTYCIVTLRRGPGRSRLLQEVVDEATELVQAGAREIVLLGQNLDAYGRELPGQPSLADLLRQVHDIPGLVRLRFLTSHPADLEEEVIDAVAELPKVCPHWELPVQAGDDDVLRRMGRGHRAADYVALIERIRARQPEASVATDIIVGFPGETAEQFERTLDLLRTVRFDAVHVAAYSVRPGTPAARMDDDVPPEEKERRRRAVEALQKEVVGQINAGLLGQEVEVLVEEMHKGRWKGRTRSNKLVFFAHPGDWHGRLAVVRITRTGPWSLQGEVQA